MRSTPRTLLAVILGFAMGLCLGPVSVFAINTRDMLRSNEEWPEWSRDYVLGLLITSIPAAVNCAIGAGVASRRGSLDRSPVTYLPAALHAIVGVGTIIMEPQSFMGLQWYTLVFTAVIWSAGRLGQRIGRGLCPVGSREPGTPNKPLHLTAAA